MSESAIRELHELAVAHAEGRLRIEAYRARRARILDSLVGLAPRVVDGEVTRPRAAAVEEPAPREVTIPVPQPAPTVRERTVPSAGGRRGLRIGVLAIGVVVAGATTWWFTRARPQILATQIPIAVNGAAPVDTVPVATVEPEALINDFLAHDGWSDSELSAFNSSWWKLADTQVVALLASPDARLLRERVAAQLATRAKNIAGGAPALDPSAPLVLLARNLSVPVPERVITGYTVPAAAPPVVAIPAPAMTPSPKVVKAALAAIQTTTAAALRNPPKLPTAAAPVAVGPADHPAVVPAATDDPCRAFLKEATRKNLKCHDTLPGGAPAPALAFIPAGTFTMGSDGRAEERPAHVVTFKGPFAMLISEVSMGEYRAFCAQGGHTCPNQPWPGDARPVVNVSWNDANDYAAWLSQLTGRHYRLPTEAEWEFVARAGSSGDYWTDAPPNEGQARFAAKPADPPTAPVEVGDSTYSPNKWLVRHMIGNVREWVADSWSDGYAGAPADGSARASGAGPHVVRGGSYRDPVAKMRSASREKLEPGARDVVTGFRLVRTLPP